MNARGRIFHGTAAIAAVCLTITACSDPTGGDRLTDRDRDETIPVSVDVNPAELVVREGDTAVLRVTVRNSKGRTLNPGAPHYLLNWSAPGVEILHEGRLANTLTIRGSRGGTSEIQFVVVPFSTPSSNGGGVSAVVEAREIRGSAKVKVVGTPTAVNVVSGDNQAAQPGGTLGEGVTVEVLDKRKKPISGYDVEFSVRSGGGSISPQRVFTDEQGHATVTWKLGSDLGEQRAAAVAGEVEAALTAVAQPEAASVVITGGNGQSAEANARLRDSVAVQVRDTNGKGVSGVSVYWTATSGGGQASPASGISDSNGVVRASWTLGGTSGTQTLNAKAPGVGEVNFTATATSGVAPGVHQVVVSPDELTFDAINDEATLSATVYDAANQTLKETVTWSSLSSGVASVDASGNVTARGAGTALIVAMASGLADTSTVTVRQVPASIEISPASVAMTVGMTTQLNATVRDAGGSTISSPSVTWQSSSPSIASVSTSGVLSALAEGTAVITATSGTVASQAAVSVGATSTVSPSSIALRIVGFKTGNVLVSSGIPLMPGALKPADVGRVRILIGGQEQPVFVKALKGRHRDGSVRSVLVQFMANIGSSPISAELAIGSARTTTDRKEAAVSFTYGSPLPAAVALPSSVDYLLRTGIVMPTVAMPSAFNTKYEDEFVRQSDGRWPLFKADYDAGTVGTGITPNYYDRALFHWAWWVRTGDAKYWQRAVYYMMAYRENYMRPNGYRVQPHNMQIEGFELHYLLTGDAESWYGVGEMADMLASPTGWLGRIDENIPDWMEGRIKSRILLGLLTAYRLEHTKHDYRALSKEAVDRILRTQQSDGAFRDWGLCNEQLNYMTGLINEVFAKYYDLVEADSRIPASMEKSLAFMWNTQWKSADGGFAYLSGGSCSGVGSHGEGKPDLNQIIAHGYGWMYRQTKNRTYRDRGDVIFNEGVNRAWFGSSTFTTADKQWNESYRSSYQYLFNRM
jgi:hypothetical protein